MKSSSFLLRVGSPSFALPVLHHRLTIDMRHNIRFTLAMIRVKSRKRRWKEPNWRRIPPLAKGLREDPSSASLCPGPFFNQSTELRRI